MKVLHAGVFHDCHEIRRADDIRVVPTLGLVILPVARRAIAVVTKALAELLMLLMQRRGCHVGVFHGVVSCWR
jgi:hypothetical protein